MTTQRERFGPVTPSDADRALAAESIRRLAPLVKNPHQLTVFVQADDGPGERLVLPAPAVQPGGVRPRPYDDSLPDPHRVNDSGGR